MRKATAIAWQRCSKGIELCLVDNCLYEARNLFDAPPNAPKDAGFCTGRMEEAVEGMIPSGDASRLPGRILVVNFPVIFPKKTAGGKSIQRILEGPRLPQFIGLLVQEIARCGPFTLDMQLKEMTYGSHAGGGF